MHISQSGWRWVVGVLILDGVPDLKVGIGTFMSRPLLILVEVPRTLLWEKGSHVGVVKEKEIVGGTVGNT